jgi:hypothetical protein
MGVTRQAAQKRFLPKASGPDAVDLYPGQGFSRFTERARDVVMAAQHEARTAGNDRIGPAHLLLACRPRQGGRRSPPSPPATNGDRDTAPGTGSAGHDTSPPVTSGSTAPPPIPSSTDTAAASTATTAARRATGCSAPSPASARKAGAIQRR